MLSPRKKAPKTDPTLEALLLRTDATHEKYSELYPGLHKRVRAIWTSDIPFVKERMERYKKAFAAQESGRQQSLARRFGLTATEAHIAMYIYEGGSVTGYAVTAQCSPATVRTHLKSLFRKTGIARQSQIATLFGSKSLEHRR